MRSQELFYNLFFKYATGLIISKLNHDYDCDTIMEYNLDNFEQSKAMELLDKIYEALKATAERNDLKIEYQIEE